MSIRKASIKETGEELPQEEWERFDAAVAEIRAERARAWTLPDGSTARDAATAGQQRNGATRNAI